MGGRTDRVGDRQVGRRLHRHRLVVALPLATSLVVYVGLGLLLPERRSDVDDLIGSLNTDSVETDEVTARRTAAVG